MTIKLFPLTLTLLLSGSSAHASSTVTYRELDDFQLIEFSGELLPLDSQQPLRQVLKQINGKKDLVLKVGESMGGAVYFFHQFIKDIKNQCTRLRGTECSLISVFTAPCGSACTILPLLSDYAIALPEATFGFHRARLAFPRIIIQTKKGLARYYAREGGNRSWFMSHAKVLCQDQTHGYWISKQDEIASGLIDEEMPSFEEFQTRYKSIKIASSLINKQ